MAVAQQGGQRVGAANMAAQAAGVRVGMMLTDARALVLDLKIRDLLPEEDARALAGLAGLFEVAGPIGQLLPSISPGYGFTAIIVAFLGRLHPVGILLAGLLIALSYLGGETVQIELGLPLAVAGVFQGMLLFFLLATDVLVRYRIRWGRKVITQEAG